MVISNMFLRVVMTLNLIAGIMAINTHMAFNRKSPPPSPSPSSPPPPPTTLKEKGANTLDFIKKCGIYMHKYSPGFLKPNAICCQSVRKVNILNFCKVFLVPDMEKIFTPKKVAFIAKHCGTPLPLNSKCGSK